MKILTRQTTIYTAIAMLLTLLAGCSDKYSGSIQNSRLNLEQSKTYTDALQPQPVQMVIPVMNTVSSASAIENEPLHLQEVPALQIANTVSLSPKIIEREVDPPAPVEKQKTSKNKKASKRLPNTITAVGLIVGMTGIAIAMIFAGLTTPLIGDPEFLFMMMGVGIAFFGAFATVLGISLASGDTPPVQQESLDETPVTPKPVEPVEEEQHDHEH